MSKFSRSWVWMKAPRAVVVQWTEAARAALRKIGSQTIREKIALKVSDLATSDRPELLGKPLRDELKGSYRIPFGRYRIIYEVTRRGAPEQTVIEITIRVV